ncbi:ABC transporter permease [Nocardioides sp.]|uniref:ABC transporter permease n=1 Tax=Nocardioides sp. TaxID=35761 RepID=UPI003527B04E
MHVWTLFWRDMRARLRDRSAIVLALLAPAALVTVMSFLVEGPDVQQVPVGFVAADAPVSQALESGPLASLEADDTLTVTAYDDEAALRTAIADGDVDAGVVVSADGGAVTVLTDPGAPIASAILESVSRSTALTVDGVGQAVLATQSLGGTADPATVVQRLTDSSAAAGVVDATEGADAIDPKTQLAAGMATFFLFFTVQFGVLGLLEERREKTLARILAAPVPPWQLLASKVLVSFVLGLVSMAFMVGFSSLLLGADWGNPLGVALLVVSGVLAAVATVSLVAGLAHSPEQAGAMQAGVALVLGIVGGSFFSMARAGGPAAVATKLTPHYWFNEGLVRMTGGQSWTAVAGPVAALLLFAAVVGIPGLVLARRTMRP